MRSENDISPREIELAIFDLLASGCATYAEIKATLNETFSDCTVWDSTGCISPRNRLASDGASIGENSDRGEKASKGLLRLSDESLYKSLSLLRKNKLIQSCRYFDRDRNRNFTLYANTDNSIELLVKEAGYRIDHIRSPYLPGRFAFWHDRDLTKVVRTIKRDGPVYYYHYGLKDEFALRRFAEKAKKGDLYPDLELNIKVKDGNSYLFRIEVQRSSARIDAFARKLRGTRNNLVLCRNRRLIYDIADTHIYVRDSALFAIIDDFIENGLFKTQWLSSECQVVGLKYYTG